eukprot:GILJ01006042.1.p1 GENE.GILJ01006042.1~~GILJ01006042.1.p1  ORF type:complete len:1275 (-),score=308.92 GILJ01006042.1:229-4053(-)
MFQDIEDITEESLDFEPTTKLKFNDSFKTNSIPPEQNGFNGWGNSPNGRSGFTQPKSEPKPKDLFSMDDLDNDSDDDPGTSQFTAEPIKMSFGGKNANQFNSEPLSKVNRIDSFGPDLGNDRRSDIKKGNDWSTIESKSNIVMAKNQFNIEPTVAESVDFDDDDDDLDLGFESAYKPSIRSNFGTVSVIESPADTNKANPKSANRLDYDSTELIQSRTDMAMKAQSFDKEPTIRVDSKVTSSRSPNTKTKIDVISSDGEEDDDLEAEPIYKPSTRPSRRIDSKTNSGEPPVSSVAAKLESMSNLLPESIHAVPAVSKSPVQVDSIPSSQPVETDETAVTDDDDYDNDFEDDEMLQSIQGPDSHRSSHMNQLPPSSSLTTLDTGIINPESSPRSTQATVFKPFQTPLSKKNNSASTSSLNQVAVDPIKFSSPSPTAATAAKPKLETRVQSKLDRKSMNRRKGTDSNPNSKPNSIPNSYRSNHHGEEEEEHFEEEVIDDDPMLSNRSSVHPVVKSRTMSIQSENGEPFQEEPLDEDASQNYEEDFEEQPLDDEEPLTPPPRDSPSFAPNSAPAKPLSQHVPVIATPRSTRILPESDARSTAMSHVSSVKPSSSAVAESTQSSVQPTPSKIPVKNFQSKIPTVSSVSRTATKPLETGEIRPSPSIPESIQNQVMSDFKLPSSQPAPTRVRNVVQKKPVQRVATVFKSNLLSESDVKLINRTSKDLESATELDLLEENKQLTSLLKQLSYKLDQVVIDAAKHPKRVKISNVRGRVFDMSPRSRLKWVSDQVESTSSELKLLMREHTSLSDRVNPLLSHKHTYELRDRLETVEEQIRQITVDNKNLNVRQKQQARDMDKGISQNGEDTYWDKHLRICLEDSRTIDEQLRRALAESSKRDSTIESQQENIAKASERLMKLEQICELRGVSINDGPDTSAGANQLKSQLDSLYRQFAVLNRSKQTANHDLDSKLKQMQVELEKLSHEKEELAEQVNKKNNEVNESNQELNQLYHALKQQELAYMRFSCTSATSIQSDPSRIESISESKRIVNRRDMAMYQGGKSETKIGTVDPKSSMKQVYTEPANAPKSNLPKFTTPVSKPIRKDRLKTDPAPVTGSVSGSPPKRASNIAKPQRSVNGPMKKATSPSKKMQELNRIRLLNQQVDSLLTETDAERLEMTTPLSIQKAVQSRIESENAAATKIQAIARGKLTRSRVIREQEVVNRYESLKQQEHTAARKIQTELRSFVKLNNSKSPSPVRLTTVQRLQSGSDEDVNYDEDFE